MDTQVTITLPDSIDRRVQKLQTEERFAGCSYQEIVQMLLEAGLWDAPWH